MLTTGDNFYNFLTSPLPVPEVQSPVAIINPYSDQYIKNVLKTFCETFYSTHSKRILILGINPGRFGAGVTGIPFTDPIRLDEICGIENSFVRKQELSSRFIYEMIEAFGGPVKFYNSFLLSAVCPIGFLNGTINYNYYDSQQLVKISSELIRYSLKKHASWNTSSTTVISLGKKNAIFLEHFNSEARLFENIITLEHPRYIMQYKLKSKNIYIDNYCRQLNDLI